MHDELNTCDRPSFLLSLSLLYLLHMGRDKRTEMWRWTDRHLKGMFQRECGFILTSQFSIIFMSWLTLRNVSAAELYRRVRGGTKRKLILNWTCLIALCDYSNDWKPTNKNNQKWASGRSFQSLIGSISKEMQIPKSNNCTQVKLLRVAQALLWTGNSWNTSVTVHSEVSFTSQ